MFPAACEDSSPAALDDSSPATPREVLRILPAAGDVATVLAGGQSLSPLRG